MEKYRFMTSILHCTTCTGPLPFFIPVFQNLDFTKVGWSQYILQIFVCSKLTQFLWMTPLLSQLSMSWWKYLPN